MTDRLVTILKIGVIILFVIALIMGGWLIYTKFIKRQGVEEIEDESIELVWWTLWEDSEDLQILADAYKAKNPNVTIRIEPQKIESQYKSKLTGYLTDDVSGNAPDIARIHNTWVPILSRYLTPLPSSVMSEADYKNVFYDTALQDLKGKDGRIYAIPLMFDGLGLYYNKTLLKTAGYSIPEDNWDDFVTQAKALTQYDSDNKIIVAGAGVGSADNIDSSFDIVCLLMLQEGSTIIDSSGKTVFSDEEDMKAAKAIKFYTDFVLRYKVWDRSLPRDITMFSEGRLAFMFAPSWRVYNINDALESVGATLDYDIAPVPQQPTVSGEQINWSNYWAEAVSLESKHSDIAWDFLKFISEPDQLRSFYTKTSEDREFGEIYPRKDMEDDLISEKYVGAYIKMVESAQSWRMIDDVKVSDEFKQLIEEIVSSGQGEVSGIQTRLIDIAPTLDEIFTSDSN